MPPLTSAPTVASADAARVQRWNGRTLGGVTLFRTCAWLLRYVGVPGSWVGSYLIGAGFMLAGGRTQYGSLGYWRRLRPNAGPLVHLMLVFRHFASFGRVLCDRFLVWLRPATFRFEYRDGDRIRRAVQAGPCILLAAHVGNWELSGFRLRSIATGTVHLVMVRSDDPYMQDFVDKRMRPEGTVVIDPRDPLGASLAIYGALSRGETVCMLGDRAYGRQPTVQARFLGALARFPIGPFHAAAITGAPIVVCFLVKTGPRSYELQVDEPFQVRLPPRRKDRAAVLQGVAQRWACRLESQVRRYPMQWHNFFDFWA